MKVQKKPACLYQDDLSTDQRTDYRGANINNAPFLVIVSFIQNLSYTSEKNKN